MEIPRETLLGMAHISIVLGIMPLSSKLSKEIYYGWQSNWFRFLASGKQSEERRNERPEARKLGRKTQVSLLFTLQRRLL